MKQPARALLGRRYKNLPLGYRVLDLDGAEVAPFTTAGVTETAPGHYIAAVEAPDAGGWIVWGTSDKPNLAESELSPTPPPIDLSPILEAQIAALDELVPRLVEATPPPPAPVITIDTGSFETGLAEVRQAVIGLITTDLTQRAEALARLNETISQLGRLNATADQALTETARQFAHLDSAAAQFAHLSTLGERLTNAGLGMIDLLALTGELATLRVEIEQLHESARAAIAATHQEANERQRTVGVIDGLLSLLEGDTRRDNAPGRFH